MEPDSSRDDEYREDSCCDSNYESSKIQSGTNSAGINSMKLVGNINMADLCDGKEVIFEISKDFERNIIDEDDLDNVDDIAHYNSKFLRENRGAPPLNCSFESLASKMFDITEDGSVKKQLISSGVGKVVPDHSYVTVHYNLYRKKVELPFDSTYLRNQPERFRLDQGEAILGLEYAIKTMKKKENSCFFIKWMLAFGKMGCPDRIEPECDIIADITLVDFVEIKNEDIPTESFNDETVRKVDFNRSLNQAKQFHLNGSDQFGKGDYQGAVRCYRKALKILNDMRLANEEQESSMLKQKAKCLVNLAVCYNKLGKHEQACVACQEVLSIDGKNAKAYFHYGKANVALSNFPQAHQLLLKANNLKPNDVDINKELKKLDEKIALFDLKDKIFWKKAFEMEKPKRDETEQNTDIKNLEMDLRKKLGQCSVRTKPYTPGYLSTEKQDVCGEVATS